MEVADCHMYNCTYTTFCKMKTVPLQQIMLLWLLVLLPQDTYGPPMGKRLLMFVDDMNMPRVDTYGTQQPIALLKMFVERKGFYDRGKELSWKNIKDVQLVAAMGPPGGARNAVDPRFISLFSAFEVQPPSNDNLRTIYQVGFQMFCACCCSGFEAASSALGIGADVVSAMRLPQLLTNCLAFVLCPLPAGNPEQAPGEVEQLRHHPDGWRESDRHHTGAVQCGAGEAAAYTQQVPLRVQPAGPEQGV